MGAFYDSLTSKSMIRKIFKVRKVYTRIIGKIYIDKNGLEFKVVRRIGPKNGKLYCLAKSNHPIRYIKYYILKRDYKEKPC